MIKKSFFFLCFVFTISHSGNTPTFYTLPYNYYYLNNSHDRDLLSIIKTLNVTLMLLNYYEEGTIAGFDISHLPDENNGKNLWWNDYFLPLKVGTVFPTSKHMQSHQKTILFYLGRFELDSYIMHDLFKRYITLHPTLIEKIKQDIQALPAGTRIGIYYEKSTYWLQDNISYQTMYDTIQEMITLNESNYTLIVLSKDPDFISFIKEKFPPEKVHIISSENCIVAAHALAQSSVLIRVAGELCDLVRIINPDLPQISLNKSSLLKE